jgi:hypothetical protein
MTPPAENAAFIAAIAVAILFFAASALAHRVTCLTPQCLVAGAIVHALTPQHE